MSKYRMQLRNFFRNMEQKKTAHEHRSVVQLPASLAQQKQPKKDLTAEDILSRPGFEQLTPEQAQEIVETLIAICENVFEIFQREGMADCTVGVIVRWNESREDDGLQKAA